MNADKELLELAAKAAGIQLVFTSTDVLINGPQGIEGRWNPLTDDGDALRLAVKLWLSIEFYEHDFERVIVSYSLNLGAANELWHEIQEPTYGKDRNEATRRAIVRAAAEIGRAMP